MEAVCYDDYNNDDPFIAIEPREFEYGDSTFLASCELSSLEPVPSTNASKSFTRALTGR